MLDELEEPSQVPLQNIIDVVLLFFLLLLVFPFQVRYFLIIDLI